MRGSIRDRLMMRSSLAPLKKPAFAIISTLQREEDTSLQVDALALTFTLITQSTGMDPHELVSRAKRQIADADAIPNPHFEAIRDYAAGELK